MGDMTMQELIDKGLLVKPTITPQLRTQSFEIPPFDKVMYAEKQHVNLTKWTVGRWIHPDKVKHPLYDIEYCNI